MKTNLLAAFLFCVLGTLSAIAQSNTLDSLEKILEKTPADTQRVHVLNNLSVQYRNGSNDLSKVKMYAEQALQLAQKLDFAYGMGQAYNSLGSYHYAQNQIQEARQYYEKALQHFERSGRKRGLAVAYGNLGMVYEDIGNFSLALEFYLRSSKIAEAIGEENIHGHNLHSIAILLQNQKKYEEALTYNFQAIKLLRAAREKVTEGFTLNSIGNIYREMHQYEQATDYLHQSLHIFDSLQYSRGQVNCYNNLGLVAFFEQQYDSALSYHQKALEKSEQYGYTNSIIVALQGLGRVYLQKQRVKEAISLLERSIQLSETHQLVQNKVDAYEGLALAYAQTGDFQQAFNYQSKLSWLKDSLFNDENDWKITQLQAGYAVEKKQAEIELLRKDQAEAALQRNAVGAGLLALLIIAGLVVSRQRLKIRKNRLLLQKSQEVTQKNEQLEIQAQKLEQQAVTLAQQTQKLQALDQLKSHFFANISHEFRTPLTLILGNLQDKLDQAAQPPNMLPLAHQEVKVMHRQAQRLLELINQLLDLSKLESGQLTLMPKAGDLRQFFHILASSFSSLADYRRIRFEVVLPNQPLYFLFDADKMEKIVSNLLSNAFKFTPDAGQISLIVEVLPETGPSSLLKITVQDSGPGIALSQLDKIFDRFYQGTQHYSDQQGTGIGLALVKELVQLHQGQVWATNQATQGSCFIVQLPLEKVEEDAVNTDPLSLPASATLSVINSSLELESTAVIPTSDSGKTVKEEKALLLIVEDNEDLRQYIRRHLESTYRILESENGRQGLAVALEHIPDLIITDLMMPSMAMPRMEMPGMQYPLGEMPGMAMPDMDGFGLCAHIKTDERTSHIPVILLTALATSQSKIQGLETGADDYLTKPFDAKELHIRIRNLIHSRQKLRERFSREVRVQPSDIAVTSMDEKFLERAMKVVEEHMSHTDFSAEAFSREIGMSRMQLHRKLTALTGQTTSDFIRIMRLQRAARLLESRAGNVSDVAFMVGFNSLPYFSKCFRAYFNVSPNVYLQEKKTSA